MMKTWSVLALAGGAVLVIGCGSMKEKSDRKLYEMFLQGSGTSGKIAQETPLTEPAPDVTPPLPDLDGDLTAMHLYGALASFDGTPGSTFAGWKMLLLDDERGAARTGDVDASGRFTLTHVNDHQSHGGGKTLALLSPDYVLTSVLSIAAAQTPATIRQVFAPTRNVLPTLVVSGPKMVFESLDGIIVRTHLASDQDADGVPDGMTFLQQSESAVDTDLDGFRNDRDADIDGDGVYDAIDDDDDGDGLVDALDPDANGNFVPEAQDAHADSIYDRARFDVSTVVTPSGVELRLRLELRDAGVPLAVQVDGSPGLLNGAYYKALGEGGQPLMVAWNRLLLDDGTSCDAAAGDGIFGQCVYLEAGRAPRPHEVIFGQIARGSAENPWFESYPFTFPPVTMGAITMQYDATTRTVLLVGNPFGEYQGFTWTTSCYDAADRLTWVGAPAPGERRAQMIPQNVRCTRIGLSALTDGPFPGFPALIVRSGVYDLD